MFSTGATGLEPATSGVTGHFQGRNMSDDGRLVAVFMRFLGFGERGGRIVERSAFGRLLPDCCPIAAQTDRSSNSPSPRYGLRSW
jgi:hypothetical protein